MEAIKIYGITLFTSKNKQDQIDLELSIPNGQWPYDGNAIATIKVASNTGEAYIAQYFPNKNLRIIKVE